MLDHLNERTLIYPEYRGNDVVASLGNISENPHIGLVFIDFFRDIIRLHVNGHATMLDNVGVCALNLPPAARDAAAVTDGRRPEGWVQVVVEEADIHCSKHIPVLEAKNKNIHWGTNDNKRKVGDFFGARRSPRPWAPAATGDAPDDTVVDLRNATRQIDLRDTTTARPLAPPPPRTDDERPVRPE